MLHREGDLLRSVNVESFPFGGKRKRPSYITYLGTPDNDQVDDLFNFTKESGTQFWNYRFSGGSLFYSQQGTGAWTVCGNGTFTGGTMRHAVLEDTLMITDGAGTIHFTTDGTHLVNNGTYLYNGTSETPAPVAVDLVEYNQRIFAAGTASDLFWSTTGTPADWTSDSSSILIPGAGKLLSTFVSQDRLIATKNSGKMFRYDTFNLVDLSTNLGPTSLSSIANIEGNRLYLNRLGFFSYGGDKPQILSNAIERQIYNDKGEGVAGTTFDNAPGVAHQYSYYCTIGTVTDDLTDETVSDAVAVYDYQDNEWGNYKFANKPTAWLSFKDENSDQQLIFGSDDGQCYQIAGTALNDNTATVDAVVEGVIHLGTPESDKRWKYLWASFNPGCQAKMQVAIGDTYTKGKKKWIDIGDCSDGVCEFRFPERSRGKLLFWKVYEASRNTRFNFYGFSVEADVIDRT